MFLISFFVLTQAMLHVTASIPIKIEFGQMLWQKCYTDKTLKPQKICTLARDRPVYLWFYTEKLKRQIVTLAKELGQDDESPQVDGRGYFEHVKVAGMAYYGDCTSKVHHFGSTKSYVTDVQSKSQREIFHNPIVNLYQHLKQVSCREKPIRNGVILTDFKCKTNFKQIKLLVFTDKPIGVEQRQVLYPAKCSQVPH